VDDSWVPLTTESGFVNNGPLFLSLQLTVSEVENALLGLDSSNDLVFHRRF
jgi:hypothetical protein